MNSLLRFYLMAIFLLLLLELSLVQTKSHDLEIKMITNYFKNYKSAAYVVGFLCWEKQALLSTIIALNLQGIRVSIPPWEHPIMSSIKLSNYGTTGILVDTNCPESVSLLEQASHMLLFNTSYHWFALGSESSNANSVFNHLSINIDAEIIMALKEDQTGNTFILQDVYSLSRDKGQPLIVNNIGHWSENDGLIIPPRELKYRERNNFNGIKMDVSVVIDRPDVSQSSLELLSHAEPTYGANTFTKYHNALVVISSEMFNFKIAYTIVPTWTSKYPNGTRVKYSVMGQIVRREVDIAAAGLAYTKSRIDQYDVVHQSWIFESAFLYRVAEAATGSFLIPFTNEAWIVILVLTIFVLLLIKMVAVIETKLGDTSESSWTVATLATLSAICQHGLEPISPFPATRAVRLIVMLSSLLLYNYYTSSVVGGLLSNPAKGFQSIYELMNSKYSLVFEEIPYIHSWFQDEHEMAVGIHEVYARKVLPPSPKDAPPKFTDNEQGVALIRKGGIAFHVEKMTAYPEIANTFTSKEICELRELSFVKINGVCLVVPKHSPLKELIRIGLNRARENGLIAKTRRKFRHPRPSCNAGAIVAPVTLGSVESAIHIMALGVFGSCVVLLFEYIYIRTRYFPIR